MASIIIQPDQKGYYHPSTEAEIQDLVKYAGNHSLQVRVRGSYHSIKKAIYTDGIVIDSDGKPDVTHTKNINIVLDQYIRMNVHEDDPTFVTVQAGIHLGRDPQDPNSTDENSLLWQLHHKHQLTLEHLGGISHQTVGGFLSTSSSGGSIRYGILGTVHGLRIIDGKGNAYEVSRNIADGTPSAEFQAALVSIGVLGVISTVTFKCTKTFNLEGKNESELVHLSKLIDIYHDEPVAPAETGLNGFFKDTDFARILWWPQSSKVLGYELKERIQTWHAKRIYSPIEPGREFTDFKNMIEMWVTSYLLTLMGNIKNEDIPNIMRLMKDMEPQFVDLHTKALIKDGEDPEKAARNAVKTSKSILILFKLITTLTQFINEEDRLRMLPTFATSVIAATNAVDGVFDFQDIGYRGLPMDNGADDIIFPCSFNEMWVPMSYASRVTQLLRDYFNQHEFTGTGNMAWELYCSKPADAWMSMSYTDGTDDWKEGAFRVDAIWFETNSQDPAEFYKPVWELLYNNNIPFRLHWGKHFPKIPSGDSKPDFDWQKHLVMDRYSHLKDFLQFRQLKDPDCIFLTDYWRYWLCVDRENELS